MLHIGLDENGYGPVMGPLVVTGVIATMDLDKDWPGDIYDSKLLFTHQNTHKELEKIALSILNISKGKFSHSTSGIFENFQQDFKCPKDISICFENLPEIPLWTTKKDIENFTKFLSAFCEKKQLKILSINSVILCVHKFNSFCRQNMKKDFINYLLFEKIILQALSKSDNLFVKAGKIGGRKDYKKFLEKTFHNWQINNIMEKPEISGYLLIRNNKKIALNFVRDIESRSFLGVLAGIYGKYIRELFMHSINSFLGTKRYISGYRDIQTKKFLNILSHKELDFDCILRIK